MNVTDFIMRSACEKAEQALSDQTRFVLDDKQWRAFMAALDRPPRGKPRLRRLFTEPHVAKRRFSISNSGLEAPLMTGAWQRAVR